MSDLIKKINSIESLLRDIVATDEGKAINLQINTAQKIKIKNAYDLLRSIQAGVAVPKSLANASQDANAALYSSIICIINISLPKYANGCTMHLGENWQVQKDDYDKIKVVCSNDKLRSAIYNYLMHVYGVGLSYKDVENMLRPGSDYFSLIVTMESKQFCMTLIQNTIDICVTVMTAKNSSVSPSALPYNYFTIDLITTPMTLKNIAPDGYSHLLSRTVLFMINKIYSLEMDIPRMLAILCELRYAANLPLKT